MKVTVELTEQQQQFLRQFAEMQHEGADDNLGTRKPLHLVQTKKEVVIFDGGEIGSSNKYFCYEDSELYDDEVELVKKHYAFDKIDIRPFDDMHYEDFNDVWIDSITDYFKAFGVKACPVSISIEYDTKAYFFTLIEAKKYIQYQAHNLHEPRTYTVAPGYSNNGDYEPFWDLLMSIGNIVLEIPEDKPCE